MENTRSNYIYAIFDRCVLHIERNKLAYLLQINVDYRKLDWKMKPISFAMRLCQSECVFFFYILLIWIWKKRRKKNKLNGSDANFYLQVYFLNDIGQLKLAKKKKDRNWSTDHGSTCVIIRLQWKKTKQKSAYNIFSNCISLGREDQSHYMHSRKTIACVLVHN